MTEELNKEESPKKEGEKDKSAEYNFAQMRKSLESERQERLRLQQQLETLQKEAEKRHSVRPTVEDEEEDDDEPYVDRKKLKREMGKFSEKASEEASEKAYRRLKSEMEEKERLDWIENTPDFEEILGHADEFAKKAPITAKNILRRNKTDFEKQQDAYYAIKEMGLHLKKEPSMQDQINSNRKSVYYSPGSSQGAPYGGAAFDASKENQKRAYEQVQAMKQRLRGG